MNSTMDGSGRIVIPKELRERVGLQPGRITIVTDGAGVRIEQPGGEGLAQDGERLVIPAAGAVVDDDSVRGLRRVDQR